MRPKTKETKAMHVNVSLNLETVQGTWRQAS